MALNLHKKLHTNLHNLHISLVIAVVSAFLPVVQALPEFLYRIRVPLCKAGTVRRGQMFRRIDEHALRRVRTSAVKVAPDRFLGINALSHLAHELVQCGRLADADAATPGAIEFVQVF